MAIDPCTSGCNNHNIGALTLPQPGDDPCDSLGNGSYCAGSYWSYDAAAAGGAFGDCDRIFLRTGSNCLADEWLELCLKDQDRHIVLNGVPTFVQVDIPDGTVPVTTINMDNVVIPVQNDSCLDMDVCIRARIWGTVTNYENHPGYTMTNDFRMTVDFGTGPQFAHVISAINRISAPTVITSHSNNVGEIEYCFVLPANTIQNVTINVDYVCDGLGPCPSANYLGFSYTIEGHTQ